MHPYVVVEFAVHNSVLQCVSLYCFYSVHPTVHKTRWSIILDVTRPGRLLHTITSAAAGGFTMWCLSSAMGGQYNSLVVQCPQQKTCLNEHHLMLVLFGVYMVGHSAFNQGCTEYPVRTRLSGRKVKSVPVGFLSKSGWIISYLVLQFSHVDMKF